MAPITGWDTGRSALSDWRTASQNRPGMKVSLADQVKRVSASPLFMGSFPLVIGFGNPFDMLERLSRISRREFIATAGVSPWIDFSPSVNIVSEVLEETSLIPVLADIDGLIIVDSDGLMLEVF